MTPSSILSTSKSSHNNNTTTTTHITSLSNDSSTTTTSSSSSDNSTTSTPNNNKKFRCIECGTAVDHIYHRRKEGRIALSQCQQCHKLPCDKYVEYDNSILLLDLLLHKKQAVRHLVFNYHHVYRGGVSRNGSRFLGDLWILMKVLACSVVLRACVYLHNHLAAAEESGMGSAAGMEASVGTAAAAATGATTTTTTTAAAATALDILSPLHASERVPLFYKFLLGTFLETLLYISLLLLLIGLFISSFVRFRYHLVCILLSCFVHLGFAPMLIWDYSKLFQASIVVLHWSMTVLSCAVVLKDKKKGMSSASTLAARVASSSASSGEDSGRKTLDSGSGKTSGHAAAASHLFDSIRSFFSKSSSYVSCAIAVTLSMVISHFTVWYLLSLPADM